MLKNHTDSKAEAVLFFARDFLCDDFPKFAKPISGKDCVYIVSKDSEKIQVKTLAPKAIVYNLTDYINKITDEEIIRDKKYETMSMNVARDRYIRSMSPPRIARIVHAVRTLLDDIGNHFHVTHYFDEPVSGFINNSVNKWVRAQGGTTCHFAPAWLPGHLFFSQDEAQNEPVELNIMSNTKDLVREHIKNRYESLANPVYVHNYSSRFTVLRASIKYYLMGLYRKYRKNEIFLDADPWPHFFQSKCLRKSLFSKYDSVEAIKALGNPKLIIFPLHYEPEAVLYFFSKYSNQVNLANDIFDNLPADSYMVIKEHPSQIGAAHLDKWKELIKNKRVLVVKGNVQMQELLQMENVAMASMGSTAALEASMFNKPVYVIGNPHFAKFPGIHHIQNFDEFDINWHQAPTDHEYLIEAYSNFLEKYVTPGIFMRGKTNMPNHIEILESLGLIIEVN